MTAIAGSRTTSWRLDAITPSGEPVARLPLRQGTGSHDWSLDAEVPLAWRCDIGSRLLDDNGNLTDEPVPELAGLWLRVTHRINGVDHLIATGPVAGRPRALTEASETWRVRGMDPTRLLQRAGLRLPLVLPTGTPVAETVRSLIATYTPSVRAEIGDTDETLREPLSYDPGDPALRVVNTLLQAAGYTTLQPRPDGVLWSQRWVPPSERATALVFDRDTQAPYLPALELDDDILSRPTEVVARTRGSQSSPPLVGRWPDFVSPDAITEVIDVEGTTTEAVTLQARRHFEERQQVTRQTSVDGPWQPVKPGDIVGFTFARHGVDFRAEVQALGTTWDLRGSTDYTLREVA